MFKILIEVQGGKIVRGLLYERLRYISGMQPFSTSELTKRHNFTAIMPPNIYDKYIMAQSSPAQSDYSALLTKIANQSLIDVLSGGIILHGQHRIGRAFFNPTLLRQYGLEGASPGGKKGLERL